MTDDSGRMPPGLVDVLLGHELSDEELARELAVAEPIELSDDEIRSIMAGIDAVSPRRAPAGRPWRPLAGRPWRTLAAVLFASVLLVGAGLVIRTWQRTHALETLSFALAIDVLRDSGYTFENHRTAQVRIAENVDRAIASIRKHMGAADRSELLRGLRRFAERPTMPEDVAVNGSPTLAALERKLRSGQPLSARDQRRLDDLLRLGIAVLEQTKQLDDRHRPYADIYLGRIRDALRNP